MKDLQQIKDQVASECGWESWTSLYTAGKVTNGMIAQVAIRYANEQNRELQDWKTSASKILNNIDLQKLGKLLGMQFGTAIDEQLLPHVTKLVDQNRELVEMLGTVLNDYHNIIPKSDARDNRMDQIKKLITKHKQS